MLITGVMQPISRDSTHLVMAGMLIRTLTQCLQKNYKNFGQSANERQFDRQDDLRNKMNVMECRPKYPNRKCPNHLQFFTAILESYYEALSVN